MFNRLRVKYYQHILNKLMLQTPGFKYGETKCPSIDGEPIVKWEKCALSPWLLIHLFITEGPVQKSYIERVKPTISYYRKEFGCFKLKFRYLTLKDKKHILKLLTSPDWRRTYNV